MKLSHRSQVDPFIVMDVMEAARIEEAKDRHIIHMEVGQPGTAAPQSAQDAVARAMRDDAMGYTVALGLPELRAKIAELYDQWYGLDLDPNRVIVTSGSSGAFLLAFAALFDAGDRVGLGMPGYPSYRQVLKSCALEPVEVMAKPENGYQPTPAEFAAHDLNGLLVASPANPTGTMLSRGELGALLEHAQDRSLAFISDEIYHGIEFEQKAVCALELSDDCYVVNSFSKYFSMTGWRIGWMVVPPGHMRTVERLAQNMFICAPHVSQVAALGAMNDTGELQANMDVYRENRRLMQQGLRDAGFTRTAPADGAFYVYADISEYTDNSLEFCKQVLEQAGVAITPGVDFDPKRGQSTIRFSYARSTADIALGLERLAKFMRENY